MALSGFTSLQLRLGARFLLGGVAPRLGSRLDALRWSFASRLGAPFGLRRTRRSLGRGRGRGRRRGLSRSILTVRPIGAIRAIGAIGAIGALRTLGTVTALLTILILKIVRTVRAITPIGPVWLVRTVG